MQFHDLQCTQKLIKYLEQNSVINKGTESPETINVAYSAYRYDRFECKHEYSPMWLVSLFEKSAKENGAKPTVSHFNVGEQYSIHLDRAKYVGQMDGKIRMTKLTLISK
jgi:hypothetical protein